MRIGMKVLALSILLSIQLSSFAQSVRIDTLKLPEKERPGSPQLKFPVVKTGKDSIDKLINYDLKNRFTNNEFVSLPTDSTLIKWSGNQISFLDFEVTYLKNGLLSLNISAELCGAYCTGWTDYFTYSLKTGKYLSLNDIVDTTGEFRKHVFAEKDKQYDEQRAELKKLKLDLKSDFDDETYQWVLEQYNSCEESFNLSSFALYPDRVEIIDKCSLPNAIKAFNPEIKIKYKYTDVRKYFKVNLRRSFAFSFAALCEISKRNFAQICALNY